MICSRQFVERWFRRAFGGSPYPTPRPTPHAPLPNRKSIIKPCNSNSVGAFSALMWGCGGTPSFTAAHRAPSPFPPPFPISLGIRCTPSPIPTSQSPTPTLQHSINENQYGFERAKTCAEFEGWADPRPREVRRDPIPHSPSLIPPSPTFFPPTAPIHPRIRDPRCRIRDPGSGIPAGWAWGL